MPKMTLTERSIEGLIPEDKLVDYYCSRIPGFYLRVHPTGSKTYGVLFRVAGRSRRLTIGPASVWNLKDARLRAREAIRLGSTGAADLAQQKRDSRTADTFADMAAQYLELWAKPRKRSWKEDERIIAKYLNPAFGRVKADDVRRADVRRLLDDLAVDAPIMANRVLACCRKIYNWAISRDLVETSPCDRVPAPAKATRRERVLTDDEIRAVWAALEAHDGPVADTYRLRLLTAQRSTEIFGMRWAEIDLDAAVWTIPEERSKNGLSHRVPLSGPVMGILNRRHRELLDDEERRARRHGRAPEHVEFVFPGRRDRSKPITATKTTGAEIAADAALKNRWTAHDLRRTAATRMAEAGTPRIVLSKVLNHAEPGVTAVYDRASYDTEKRNALNTWAALLMEIVSK